MAKVQVGNLEIDEEELRASLKLRETVGAILKNPKARRLMLPTNWKSLVRFVPHH